MVPLADGPHTLLTVKFPLRDAVGVRLCGLRHLDRRDRAEARPVRARRARRARAGQPREERVPLAGQPRAAHAAERDPRASARCWRSTRSPTASRTASQQIMKGGRHLLELVNDLLEISRDRVGRAARLAGTGRHRAGRQRHRADGRAAGRRALRHDHAPDRLRHADRARGRAARQAGAPQPDLERDQVQPRRRPCRRRRAARRRVAGSRCASPTPATGSPPTTSSASSAPSSGWARSRPGSRAPASGSRSPG